MRLATHLARAACTPVVSIPNRRKDKTRTRTNDVRAALAAVLAPLEADEALEGTEEAVLRGAASAETACLVVLALVGLLRALGRAHRVCKAEAACVSVVLETQRHRSGTGQAQSGGEGRAGTRRPSRQASRAPHPTIDTSARNAGMAGHSLIWTAWGWVVVVIAGFGASMAMAGLCARMR